MRFKLLFAWYDLWVGIFYDKNKNWIYILPIPMFGVIVKLPQWRYWIYSERINDYIGSTVKSELENMIIDDKLKFIKYLAYNGEIKPLFGNDYNQKLNEDR